MDRKQIKKVLQAKNELILKQLIDNQNSFYMMIKRLEQRIIELEFKQQTFWQSYCTGYKEIVQKIRKFYHKITTKTA
jgi:uncharacterized protein (UPF0128 family)